MSANKSAVGVSPWLLFLNSLCTFLVALEFVLIEDISCSNSTYRCFIDRQPLLQMLGSAILCATLWFWFLRYYRHDHEPISHPNKLSHPFITHLAPIAFFNAFLIIAISSTLIALLIRFVEGATSPPLIAFAQSCGILSTTLNSVMWIPQIIVTATYGHKGSISILWILCTVLMDVVYSVYLSSTGRHWTVWANNVPDALQTFILLILLLRIEYRDHLAGVDDYGNPIHPQHSLSSFNHPQETSPLISSFDKHPSSQNQLPV